MRKNLEVPKDKKGRVKNISLKENCKSFKDIYF